MAAASSFVEYIGRHEVRFAEPDEYCVTMNGPLSLDEAEQLVEMAHMLGREHGLLRMMVDVSGFESSGQRIRQVFIKGNGTPYPLRAVAIYGASFPVRIAMTMVLTAGAHILPENFQYPVEFVATEAQARVWLDKYRSDASSERTGPSWAESA